MKYIKGIKNTSNRNNKNNINKNVRINKIIPITIVPNSKPLSNLPYLKYCISNK